MRICELEQGICLESSDSYNIIGGIDTKTKYKISGPCFKQIKPGIEGRILSVGKYNTIYFVPNTNFNWCKSCSGVGYIYKGTVCNYCNGACYYEKPI
jgi:hypothetical protein